MRKSKKPRSKRDKDLGFLMVATSISLVIMSMLLTFAPYMDIDNPRIGEIKAVESQMKAVPPKDLPYMLASASSKPVMLVFYASWCAYCHKLVPRIVELIEENKLDHVTPIFLSLDSQPRLLSKYLVSSGFADRFQPFIIKQMFYSNLVSVMRGTGSGFTGAIPYVGFFDTSGKAVAEISGLVDKQEFLAVANQLKKTAN